MDVPLWQVPSLTEGHRGSAQDDRRFLRAEQRPSRRCYGTNCTFGLRGADRLRSGAR